MISDKHIKKLSGLIHKQIDVKWIPNNLEMAGLIFLLKKGREVLERELPEAWLSVLDVPEGIEISEEESAKMVSQLAHKMERQIDVVGHKEGFKMRVFFGLSKNIVNAIRKNNKL